MKTAWRLALLGGLAACAAADASPQRRVLDDLQTRQLIEALAKERSALSEDPSCKSDLSRPGSMSVAEGLGVALLRAATDRRPVLITADCGARPGHPIGPGQEYCRLGFAENLRTGQPAYGLALRMDWSKQAAVPGSVECF